MRYQDLKKRSGMIKLKNEQVAGFLSPIVSKLFDDKERRFPISAAFKLSDLIDQVQKKANNYQKHARSIVEKYGGDIKQNGMIVYASVENKEKAQLEMDELNSIEVEVMGDRLEWDDNWPDLSINEAFILKPLINTNGKG